MSDMSVGVWVEGSKKASDIVRIEIAFVHFNSEIPPVQLPIYPSVNERSLYKAPKPQKCCAQL